MGMFQRSAATCDKRLATELKKQRDLHDNLVKRLEAAEAAVVAAQQNAEALELNEASDAEQAKAGGSNVDAEHRVRTVLGALETTRAKIAEIEAEIASLADAEQRRKTAAEIELIVNDLSAIEQKIVADAAVLVEVASRAEPATLDAAGLRLLGQRLQTEFADAAHVVISGLRAHSVAVIGGHAPAALRRPEPKAPASVVPPEPKVRVFTMTPIKWREGGAEQRSAKHQQVDLPTAIAARALKTLYAIEMTNPRSKTFYVGFVPAPPSAYCVDLDDVNLKPLKPIFGPDIMKRDAQFHVTRGGSESWINAERG
jgi:hypothetical protein